MSRLSLCGLSLLLVYVVTLSGCPSHMQDRDTLDKALEELNEGVRWGRHDVAVRRLPPNVKQSYLDRAEQMNDKVAIHDFETTRVNFGNDGNTAVVRIEVQWYQQDEGVSRKTVIDEKWERIASYWVLTGTRKIRGEPLAIFDLAPEDANATAPRSPTVTPSRRSSTVAPSPHRPAAAPDLAAPRTSPLPR